MTTKTSNIVYKDFKLISMIDFVFMLRNRTSNELANDLPNNFFPLRYNGDQNQAVKDMLAIDSIQWQLTGEYAKFLSKNIEEKHFDKESPGCLFKNFEKTETRGFDKFQFVLNQESSNFDIYNDEQGFYYVNSPIQKIRISKVQDLLSFSQLYLTDYAIKSIFGWGGVVS